MAGFWLSTVFAQSGRSDRRGAGGAAEGNTRHVADVLLDHHLVFLEDAPVLVKGLGIAWSTLPGTRCSLEPCSVGAMMPGMEDDPLFQFLVFVIALGYPSVVALVRLFQMAKGILLLTPLTGFAGTLRGAPDVVTTAMTTFLPPRHPAPVIPSLAHAGYDSLKATLARNANVTSTTPEMSSPDVLEAATTT